MNPSNEFAFSRAIVTLFKHAIYQEADVEHWDTLLTQKHRIEDYVSKIGLTVVIDEADGYAYLKQRLYDSGEEEIPRIIPRHQLSYEVSLLLLLLRKQLQEFDASTGDRRLILTRTQIVDRMKVYLANVHNEVKQVDQINRYIEQVAAYGFLRRMRGDDNRYEVQRIIRSFVDTAFLSKFEDDLSNYTLHKIVEDE
ncbi:MAG: DUF4194 domain-containing protein [Defluviitaleaceae bacterium]|nr:DUF4194 domain-containing protein [Defluviitaleaceae bacterium]MCL2273868.1 DUF4194 domain-containing protein [Defluviitaleaceae bacterium]